MKTRLSKVALAVSLALAGAGANAALERVGPTSTANGYPTWYQDTTGLALEFCTPLNQQELNEGWCLLLAGDTTVPEVFPTTFADEHFYFAGDAGIDFTLPNGNASRARLILGLEAAFAGAVEQGGQMVFGRVRVVINELPYDGDYSVITPYGTFPFPNQAAGSKLFFTEDIGFNCPTGQFDCANQSHIGPFLIPSDVPGGTENLPVASPGGRLHIADPARLGAVTGSPFGTNIFKIVGPNGWSIETTDFALMGRIWEQGIPGKVTVDRANFARRAGDTPEAAAKVKVDVMATGTSTQPSRVPPNPRPALVPPQLSFYGAPCTEVLDAAGNVTGLAAPAGFAEINMSNAGNRFWGQIQPADVPAGVCVKDNAARNAAGNPMPAYFKATVSDEVYITSATYDPAAQTLSVLASSSDETGAPTLTVDGYAGSIAGMGQISVPALSTPPARVRVASSALGSAELPVVTGWVVGAPGGSGGGASTATDDAVTTDEQVAIPIAVTANDIAVDPATVRVIQAATLGTTSVDAVSGVITYSPALNKFGTDTFTYVVKGTNGVDTNVATVTVTINNVGDPTVTAADAVQTTLTTPVTINVLANDTDVDMPDDVLTVNLVNVPAADVATLAVLPDGRVTYTPNAANPLAASGNKAFSYTVTDRFGNVSAETPVSVTVIAQEAIATQKSLFRTGSNRWVVAGTSSVRNGQEMVLRLRNTSGGTCSYRPLGTAVVDPIGDWAFDEVNSPTRPLLNANGNAIEVIVVSSPFTPAKTDCSETQVVPFTVRK